MLQKNMQHSPAALSGHRLAAVCCLLAAAEIKPFCSTGAPLAHSHPSFFYQVFMRFGRFLSLLASFLVSCASLRFPVGKAIRSLNLYCALSGCHARKLRSLGNKSAMLWA